MKDELINYVPTKTDIKIFNTIFEKGYYSPPNCQSPSIKKLLRLGIVEYRDDFKGVYFTEIGKQLSPKWFYPWLYTSIGLAVVGMKLNAVKKVIAANVTEKQTEIDPKVSEAPTEIKGHKVVFYYKTDYKKHGLTEEKVEYHDIMDEYAVVECVDANCGIMVFYRINRDDAWQVNPWSMRFLIRILLENIGITFTPIK